MRMRLLGALLLMMSGMWAGVTRQQAALARVRALEELLRLLQKIRREIQYRALPLDEIYEQLEKNETHLNLTQWHSLRTPCLPTVLPEAERRTLEHFFAHLGEENAEETCIQLSYMKEQCECFVQDARQRASAAAKLELPACICLGTLAALLAL